MKRDYKTIITKIKNSTSFTTEAIVYMGFPVNNMIFLNDVYKLNYKIPVYLQVANYDNVNQGAKDALKFLEPISVWYTFSKEKSTDFVNFYKDRFGFEPDAEAAYNYTGMKIMFEAIDFCGKDKKCFNEYITSTEFKDHLVSDIITFDKNGNSILPVDLIKYDAEKEDWVKYP